MEAEPETRKGTWSQAGWRGGDPESRGWLQSSRPRGDRRRCQDPDLREETQSTRNCPSTTSQHVPVSLSHPGVSSPYWASPTVPKQSSRPETQPPPLHSWLCVQACVCACVYSASMGLSGLLSGLPTALIQHSPSTYTLLCVCIFTGLDHTNLYTHTTPSAIFIQSQKATFTRSLHPQSHVHTGDR